MSVELEAILAQLLTSGDPAAELENLRSSERSTGLAPQTLQALRHIDPDGLRISALLVAKLRFERLMNGSREAGEWFAKDPAGFSATFRRYHTSQAPTATGPGDEADAFRAWLANDSPAS